MEKWELPCPAPSFHVDERGHFLGNQLKCSCRLAEVRIASIHKGQTAGHNDVFTSDDCRAMRAALLF